MKYSIIIPARYKSTRLPGKPLVSICDKPMIIRTWEQCIKVVDSKYVYVATEDERVEKVCLDYGIQVIMTSDKCLTGTDRVAECATQLDSDLFINVQGDEPLFNPGDIKLLIDEAQKSPDIVLNGYCSLNSEEQYNSRQIPKVVFDISGKLLYMSRGPIPSNKEGTFKYGWRQVCAYSFPRKALSLFAQQEQKSPLERVEDIEILRFLELGIKIRMIEMSNDSIPVDNPEDIKKVEEIIYSN